MGRVGHIYPWNTLGAEFTSLRVTSSVRVACPNAFIPDIRAESTVEGVGWVSLPRPSDGTASEVAESCRSICVSYLDSLADPMDGACWSQTTPCHNNLCDIACAYMPYGELDRVVSGTAWQVTLCEVTSI